MHWNTQLNLDSHEQYWHQSENNKIQWHEKARENRNFHNIHTVHTHTHTQQVQRRQKKANHKICFTIIFYLLLYFMVIIGDWMVDFSSKQTEKKSSENLSLFALFSIVIKTKLIFQCCKGLWIKWLNESNEFMRFVQSCIMFCLHTKYKSFELRI